MDSRCSVEMAPAIRSGLEVCSIGGIRRTPFSSTIHFTIFSLQVGYPDVFCLIEHLDRMGEGSATHSRQLGTGRDTFLAMAAAYQSKRAIIPTKALEIYLFLLSCGLSAFSFPFCWTMVIVWLRSLWPWRRFRVRYIPGVFASSISHSCCITLPPPDALRAQIMNVIGWKPHASQPQPKKRGSASKSLKEVL